MEHVDGTAADTARSRLIGDFSIEMTGKDVQALTDASAALPQGTRVNVTFLGNEDLEMRVAAARAVRELGFVPVPHISARRLRSQDELEEFLGRLQEVGASEHVFAVAGDPPEPLGPFSDALELIASGVLPRFGVQEVSIAGYPEGHPDVPTEQLWRAMDDKAASLREQGLASVLLTQFAFDTEPVVDWIGGVRGRGIDAPIRIGTPGPAGIKRLLGFARRFGIGANATIVKKYGFSLSNLIGTAGPDRFVTALAEELGARPDSGVVRLHFYAFGGLEATARWVADFAGAAR
jgi:methylenetetrahydrofolate reductase (NADPH)